MAYVPSVALADVLERAKAGIWFESLLDGRIGLVCKIPENVIRALYSGAECLFLFSVVEVQGFDILCLGLRIMDEPDHPFTYAVPWLLSRDPTSPAQEVEWLKTMLRDRSATLHCLNELNHPVLSASCKLEPARAQEGLEGLESSSPFVLSGKIEAEDLLRLANAAMKRFQEEIYLPDDGGAATRKTNRIPLFLELWEPTEVFEVTSIAQGGPFRIDDKDEGGKQERHLHLSLASIYAGNTYKSPTVGEGNSRRELTDIFGFDAGSICLIESKALNMLTASITRSSSRRASTMMRRVKTGLRQLGGALRAVRSDATIYDSMHQPIPIENRQTLPAHAIVLLSEMYFFIDWKLIADEVVAASENERHRALFHVIDFLELSHIIEQSNDACTFFNIMSQRWLRVKMTGTAYIRMVVPARPE